MKGKDIGHVSVKVPKLLFTATVYTVTKITQCPISLTQASS